MHIITPLFSNEEGRRGPPFIKYLNLYAKIWVPGGQNLPDFARCGYPMEPEKSEILLISISLCFIIGGTIFAAMVVGREYGILEIPYAPYILLIIAVIIVILAGLIVIFGEEQGEKGEKEKAW